MRSLCALPGLDFRTISGIQVDEGSRVADHSLWGLAEGTGEEEAPGEVTFKYLKGRHMEEEVGSLCLTLKAGTRSGR